MTSRRLHRTIGLILLLPFITWSLTAVFFLIRPRYEQAYETLAVRQHPLRGMATFAAEPDWQEIRYFQTTLGTHLLVKKADTWHHLDPQTLQLRPPPTEEHLVLLLKDAFTRNPARYGKVASVKGNRITTTTGVTIDFNWNTLGFAQEGRDTRWINRIYDIHYLEWTGLRWLDKVLGLSGLTLLMYMTYSGSRLALRRPAPRPSSGV